MNKLKYGTIRNLSSEKKLILLKKIIKKKGFPRQNVPILAEVFSYRMLIREIQEVLKDD